MGTFVVYNLLSQTEAQYTYDGIRQWFKDNPTRTDCATETFMVRRDHIKEDILKNSEQGTVLQEEPTNTNFEASLPKDKPKKKSKKNKKSAPATKKAAKKPR